jgi:hypothetical protein
LTGSAVNGKPAWGALWKEFAMPANQTLLIETFST